MQKVLTPGSSVRTGESQRPHLPDPAISGPYRAFATDPGWSEAWWWLGIPVLVAVFVIGAWLIAPQWYLAWVIPEGYGILELSHFIVPLIGLSLAVRLLFDPFVRRRPLVLGVAILAGISCLYIAGEEVSWGQHFFHWTTPEYWAEINRQQETNLHNTYGIFEKWPRAILEIGVVFGGLVIPLAAAFDPRVYANRLSLFLPAAALMPTAIGAMAFKLLGIGIEKGYVGQLLRRPSETVEIYLYFFILAYLIVYARRLRDLEREEPS